MFGIVFFCIIIIQKSSRSLIIIRRWFLLFSDGCTEKKSKSISHRIHLKQCLLYKRKVMCIKIRNISTVMTERIAAIYQYITCAKMSRLLSISRFFQLNYAISEERVAMTGKTTPNTIYNQIFRVLRQCALISHWRCTVRLIIMMIVQKWMSLSMSIFGFIVMYDEEIEMHTEFYTSYMRCLTDTYTVRFDSG